MCLKETINASCLKSFMTYPADHGVFLFSTCANDILNVAVNKGNCVFKLVCLTEVIGRLGKWMFDAST